MPAANVPELPRGGAAFTTNTRKHANTLSFNIVRSVSARLGARNTKASSNSDEIKSQFNPTKSARDWLGGIKR